MDEWDLTTLFYNDQIFFDEVQNLKNKTSELEQITDIKLEESILTHILNLQQSLLEKAHKILLYGSLRYYQNVTDSKTEELKSISEKTSNEIIDKIESWNKDNIRFTKKEWDEFLINHPSLKVFDYYMIKFYRTQDHILHEQSSSSKKEEIRKEVAEYNSKLKKEEYGTIEINDSVEELTSSNIAKFLAASDGNTRRKTYNILKEHDSKEADFYSQLLNKIYKSRVELASNEKYPTVRSKVLIEQNLPSSLIDNLIFITKKHLALIQEYFKVKAKLLNIESPHMYDLGVPFQNTRIHYDLNDAIKNTQEALSCLGTTYINFLLELQDKKHLNLIPTDFKHQTITFSWDDYVFTNYKGSYVDMKNIAHEVGHALNYHFSNQKQPIFSYQDSTAFLGEIASTTNELLLNRYLQKTASTIEEKIFYLSKNIENFYTSIIKPVMYTEFESTLYAKIENNDELSTDFINETYKKLVEAYHKNSVELEDFNSSEWIRLGQIYRYNYYYYQYATGLLISSHIVEEVIDKKTLPLEKYLDFLSLGSSQDDKELLKSINVDISNTDFIENGFRFLEIELNTLKEIVKEIEQ